MSSSFFGHRIIHLESVDSTNNYTAKVFKSGNVQPGAVIMADIQTNGRGQRDKTWQSGAFENLTFSLTADINLWKINTLVDLNRIIAIALHSFFRDIGFLPKIKWPNDIMINDQKVCGILIENFFRSGQPQSIIGIGINVNQQHFDAPRATSILNESGSHHNPKELLFRFIKVLNDTFEELPLHDSKEIHFIYDKFLWKRDEEWQFETTNNNSLLQGKINGTTMDGNLILHSVGETMTFANGSIKY